MGLTKCKNEHVKMKNNINLLKRSKIAYLDLEKRIAKLTLHSKALKRLVNIVAAKLLATVFLQASQ